MKPPPTTAPRFDKYELGPVLASGGMATVYRARRRADGMPCVVKVVHEIHAQNATVAARFVREARVVSLLDHPHVARLIDARTEGGHFYTAMEWVRGCDLRVVTATLRERSERLPLDVALRIALDVLDGLDYAHRFVDPEGQHLAIAHRDLSPKNIVLGRDGAVKIIDFGLARANFGDFRTATGLLLGTPAYMAPEQAAGDRADAATDIYAWGVVLFELLTGRMLIEGATVDELLRAALLVDVSPPSSLVSDVPPALDVVVMRALEKRPADRFDSARSFADAIRLAVPSATEAPRSAIAALVESVAPSSDADEWSVEEPGPTPVLTRAAASPRPEPPRPPSSRRWRVWPWALVAVAAGAVLVWMNTPRPDPSQPVVVDGAPSPLPIVAPRIRPTVIPSPVPTTTVPDAASDPGPVVAKRTRVKDPGPRSLVAPVSKEPSQVARVRALRGEVEAYRDGRRTPDQLLRTAERIERELRRLPVETARHLKGRAAASAIQNDVADLFVVLDAMEAASK